MKADIDPKELNLSQKLITELQKWLEEYQNEYFIGYENNDKIESLDNKGIELAIKVKKELGNIKIAYFSDAKANKKRI